jgi:hypothetical protein
VGNIIDSIFGVEFLRAGAVRYDPEYMRQSYATTVECFYKYPIFNGEREFRIVAYSDNPKEMGIGKLISIDVEAFINRIYVSPDAEYWFVNLVQCFLSDAGIMKEIHRTQVQSG